MPLAILLEFHGWWHVLTAVAVYVFMALIEFLTRSQPEQDRGVGFAWPVKAVLEETATTRLNVKGSLSAECRHEGDAGAGERKTR